MEKAIKPKLIEIDKLKPSRLHTEIFKCFEKKYKGLNKRILNEGFNSNCHLIVRVIKGGYEIICGIGRYNYLKNKTQADVKGDQPATLVPCIVDNSSDYELLILMLSDNFFGCRSITNLTEFQFYLLGWLLHLIHPSEFTGELIEEHFSSEINIGPTIYSYLNPTMTRILQILAKKNEIELNFDSTEIALKQIMLLINKSLEDDIDKQFTLFFTGKKSIFSAYEYYSGKKAKKRKENSQSDKGGEKIEKVDDTQITQNSGETSDVGRDTGEISPIAPTKNDLKAEAVSIISVIKKLLNAIEAGETLDLGYIPNKDQKIVQRFSGLISKQRNKQPDQKSLFEEPRENQS